MKKSMVASAVLLAALGGLLLRSVPAVNAQGAKTAVVWPAGDIKWTDNPAIKGAKIAALWGDPAKGAYGALKTLPGGTELAAHTHTYDQRVVQITGTIVAAVSGGAPKELTAGSFALFPAGVPHSANCKAGAECKYFEEQPGAADIKFVEKPRD